MTFTDDDLERFKKIGYQPPGIDSLVQIQVRELKALLARLEAAESYARYGDLLHGGKSAECVLGKCDMCRAKEAWRKTAGLAGTDE